MKVRRIVALLGVCATIAACDMTGVPNFNYSGAQGKITLTNHLLTLHADNAPDASIAATGELKIDGKTVTISSTQRGLLMLYFQGVADIRDQSTNMGKAGAEAGVKALSDSVNGKPDPNEKQKIDGQASTQTHQLLLKMCQDETNLKAVQDQLVVQLPDFKPYGNIFSGRSVDDCMKDKD